MKIREALQKLRGKTAAEVMTKSSSVLRGLFAASRLEHRTLISVRGSLKIIKKNGMIAVGEYTEFWPDVKLSCFGRNRAEPAKIVIGKCCSIGDRTEIHAGKQVEIGDNVIISWDCVLLDRDYHADAGEWEVCKPVRIEDGAWIGCRVIILKGVTIGKGAI